MTIIVSKVYNETDSTENYVRLSDSESDQTFDIPCPKSEISLSDFSLALIDVVSLYGFGGVKSGPDLEYDGEQDNRGKRARIVYTHDDDRQEMSFIVEGVEPGDLERLGQSSHYLDYEDKNRVAHFLNTTAMRYETLLQSLGYVVDNSGDFSDF